MDLLKSIGSISLIILFSLALFIFMVRFIDANNPQQAISSTDPFINSSMQSLQDRSDELGDIGETSQQLLEAAEPSPVFLFLILKAAFDIPRLFIGFLVKAIGTILTILFVSLFGTGETPYHVVFGLITGIMVITVIVIIVREIRTGRS